jgi:hypothetical protein
MKKKKVTFLKPITKILIGLAILIILIVFYNNSKKRIHEKGCFFHCVEICDAINTVNGKHYQVYFNGIKKPGYSGVMQDPDKPPYNSFIEFTGIIHNELGGTCMIGPIIEVTQWKLIKTNCSQEDTPMPKNSRGPK